MTGARPRVNIFSLSSLASRFKRNFIQRKVYQYNYRNLENDKFLHRRSVDRPLGGETPKKNFGSPDKCTLVCLIDSNEKGGKKVEECQSIIVRLETQAALSFRANYFVVGRSRLKGERGGLRLCRCRCCDMKMVTDTYLHIYYEYDELQ